MPTDRAIHWFPVPVGGIIGHDIRDGGRIIHVGMHRSEPAIWVEVRPDGPDVRRHFIVAVTGGAVMAGWVHCGSVVDDYTGSAWHVYEVPVPGSDTGGSLDPGARVAVNLTGTVETVPTPDDHTR